MNTVDVINAKGKKVDTVTLDGSIFDRKVSSALLHQAVTVFLANQRKGLACAKTRGMVRGGGAKPWRQKGTGRARFGSSRTPLWRGGGVIFGPLPRDYSKHMPRRMKLAALKSALNTKFRQEEISVVDSFTLKTHKTKELFKTLSCIRPGWRKVTLVIESVDNNIRLASRNIPSVCVQNARELTTYTAMDCKTLIFTRGALETVQERIKNGIRRKSL